jgi:hypothetical protein
LAKNKRTIFVTLYERVAKRPLKPALSRLNSGLILAIEEPMTSLIFVAFLSLPSAEAQEKVEQELKDELRKENAQKEETPEDLKGIALTDEVDPVQ